MLLFVDMSQYFRFILLNVCLAQIIPSCFLYIWMKYITSIIVYLFIFCRIDSSFLCKVCKFDFEEGYITLEAGSENQIWLQICLLFRD